MLIQFSVRNFKTFKEKAVLSMVASNYDKGTREEDNVQFISPFNLRLLKSSVLYGANASGKSKFLEALLFMKRLVINSSKETQKGDPIDVEPFKLSTGSENDSSEFEAVFLYQEIQYRYGFEVNQSHVIAEWLYQRPKTKEVQLFYRDETDFEIHDRNFSKGATVVKEGLVRDNALFLSVAAQFNEVVAGNVTDWFKNIGVLSGLNEDGYQGFTMRQTDNPLQKKKILALLQAADINIEDVVVENVDVSELMSGMPAGLKEILEKEIKNDKASLPKDVLTTHRKYDETNTYTGPVQFSLARQESSGTKKFFALTGPILDALETGSLIVADELGSTLHTNLVCKIVSLFNSKELNPKNAQLIFNTHDTNLLDSGLFRRDQIWFTQKNRYGAASLYSLADFKTGIRKTEPFEDNYIKGRYGAVPYLNNFEEVFLPKLLRPHENEG